MLTGDSERVARAVAQRTGVTEWQAGLLPEDKLAAVRALREKHGPTAMVGDGVNDAPALAGATVGVAMGVAGSGVALESADVALMGDQLDRLPEALSDSRRALRVMRQNVAISLATKAIFVVLAPLGFVTLIVAVVADMGVSLLVTLNGLRLLRNRSERAAPGGAYPAAATEPTSVGGCTDASCSGGGVDAATTTAVPIADPGAENGCCATKTTPGGCSTATRVPAPSSCEDDCCSSTHAGTAT